MSKQKFSIWLFDKIGEGGVALLGCFSIVTLADKLRKKYKLPFNSLCDSENVYKI